MWGWLESAVAGQAYTEVHSVLLAPQHDAFAGKARVGAQENRDVGKALADLGDDPVKLFDAACRAVDIRPAQSGTQQMLAAEDVERQVAVAVVVAVKEASFLLPVQRIVGRVEVQDDALGYLVVAVEKQLDEEAVERLRVDRDAVVAIAGCLFGQTPLESIQRALAGQGRPAVALAFAITTRRVSFADTGGQKRVVAQLVVVDQILVAQRETEDALW